MNQFFFGQRRRFARTTPKALAIFSTSLFLRLVIFTDDGNLPVCFASS
jgi:hypothetical protein